MPLFKGTIFKHTIQNPTEEWSNVYHINAADEAAAMVALDQVMNVEANVSYDNVVFDRLYVRLDNPLATAGVSQAVSGLVGARGATPANQLPLFNTVRVVFTDGINRPDQKYLRLPLEVSDVSGDFLDVGMVSLITTDYINDILAFPGVVSSSGDTYSAGSCMNAIQMRQLHWSRRSRPGFHRGYVPNA